jgi:hypothetical protein
MEDYTIEKTTSGWDPLPYCDRCGDRGGDLSVRHGSGLQWTFLCTPCAVILIWAAYGLESGEDDWAVELKSHFGVVAYRRGSVEEWIPLGPKEAQP